MIEIWLKSWAIELLHAYLIKTISICNTFPLSYQLVTSDICHHMIGGEVLNNMSILLDSKEERKWISSLNVPFFRNVGVNLFSYLIHLHREQSNNQTSNFKASFKYKHLTLLINFNAPHLYNHKISLTSPCTTWSIQLRQLN